jgi:5'-nucleotidase
MPDLVLSGINHGANVGRAVLHSGTVGAILTASVHGVRGLAVSLDVALHPTGERHWDAADDLFPRVLELLLDAPAGTSLSLNVPDRPADRHRELRHARLAAFGTVQARVDEVGDGGLRLGEVEVGTEPEEGTDGALLAAGHPTLTALRSVTEDESGLVPDWLARSGPVRT